MRDIFQSLSLIIIYILHRAGVEGKKFRWGRHESSTARVGPLADGCHVDTKLHETVDLQDLWRSRADTWSRGGAVESCVRELPSCWLFD